MKIICAKIKPIIQVLSLSFIALVMVVIVSITSTEGLYFGYAANKLVPIYSVETTEKKVALTFDAAWGSDKTLSIVNILKEADIEGTFFLVGFWTEQNADKVKQIDEAGFDIGTHSNTHPKMSGLTKTQIESELKLSMNLITDITGKQVKYFRPPFGDYNNTLISTADELGLKTIQWDVDTLDWKGISEHEILSRIKASVKNGSIILCHNNSDHIVEALPTIINYIKQEGYKMVKLSDLVYEKNYIVNNNGIQKLK